MISRVADHCFWFGRYVERAEATARMLEATLRLSLDGELGYENLWHPVVVVAGEQERYRELQQSQNSSATPDAHNHTAHFLTWHPSCGTSLLSSIRSARWNAQAIRDVLSSEAWEATNDLYLYIVDSGTQIAWRNSPSDVYHVVRNKTQLTLGLLRSTMLHDEAMDFMWLGVLLERINQTARLLDVHHHALDHGPEQPNAQSPVIRTAVWSALLQSLSGTEAFMKRNAGRVSADAVATFLLFEQQFPRSIGYCVASALQRLSEIRPPHEEHLPGGASVMRLSALAAWLASQSRKPIADVQVHAVLTRVVDAVHAICDDLASELLGASKAGLSEGAVAQ
jgi:uncharacterized alpha-E superfamily protein